MATDTEYLLLQFQEFLQGLVFERILKSLEVLNSGWVGGRKRKESENDGVMPHVLSYSSSTEQEMH